MIYISNNCINPYFNLAAEEYLLKNFDEDIFMLWRNSPSIIIGKNQNTLSEINYEYVKNNNITVVRRLSGGGAVFHDLGNINFTFIAQDTKAGFESFKKFTTPILEVLTQLGINAEFSGRNDLTIEGKKFSGNAQYHYKNRILHHGTLLFESNISNLSAALCVKASKFQGKSVKSVTSRVTNIREHLKGSLTINEFIEQIMQYIMKENKGKEICEFNSQDIEKIEMLVQEKYNTWQWNYGDSPKYTFSNCKRYAGGTVEFNLNVEKGIIKDVKIFGDFFGRLDVCQIEGALIGLNHSESEIRQRLQKYDLSSYFYNITLDEILEGLL